MNSTSPVRRLPSNPRPSGSSISHNRMSSLRQQRTHELVGQGRQLVLSQWLSTEVREKDERTLAEKSAEDRLNAVGRFPTTPVPPTPLSSMSNEPSPRQYRVHPQKQSNDLAVSAQRQVAESILTRRAKPALSPARSPTRGAGVASAPATMATFGALPAPRALFFVLEEDEGCARFRHVPRDIYAASPLSV